MTCLAGKQRYAYLYTLSLTEPDHSRLYHGVTVIDYRITNNQQYEAFKRKLKEMHSNIYASAVLIKLALLGEPI